MPEYQKENYILAKGSFSIVNLLGYDRCEIRRQVELCKRHSDLDKYDILWKSFFPL